MFDTTTGTMTGTGTDSATLEWNVRTINNQEITPGLYIFAVETPDDKHIGKFAVIRQDEIRQLILTVGMLLFGNRYLYDLFILKFAFFGAYKKSFNLLENLFIKNFTKIKTKNYRVKKNLSKKDQFIKREIYQEI